MEIKSLNNSIVYNDTEDHFNNGFLRLMNMDRETFEKWINLSSQYNDLIYNSVDYKLSKGFKDLYSLKEFVPITIEFGYVWIKLDETYYIARSYDNSIGWLVKQNLDGKFIKETSPPVYEEEYFEGDSKVAGGYENYIEQASWRLEKSVKQINELSSITGLQAGYILDVGSGYGYFRKAADDAGFKHEGIEISKHANKISKEIFGFDSNVGFLSDYVEKFKNCFDVVVLSDVIEHVPEPTNFLKEVYSVLKPGGFVIVKTPNIDCPEAEIFGQYYHSLKREHLVYFTYKSLVKAATTAGLSPFHITTISHLLKGFIGDDEIKKLAACNRGSDLVAYFRKD